MTKEKKKRKIKISNIDQFKKYIEEYNSRFSNLAEDYFREILRSEFSLSSFQISKIYELLLSESITFRADNILDFMEYIKNMTLFEEAQNKLWKEIALIERLIIDRIEYEREKSIVDDVSSILKDIEEAKLIFSSSLSNEDKERLSLVEEEIDRENIYTKDIELLKKMITSDDGTFEEYDSKTKVKRLFITIPNKLNHKFIKAEVGSVEYHHHIRSNIPRINRLIKNLHKYLEPIENQPNSFRINQTNIIQDTVNLAIATYDNIEFRAISGANNPSGFCSSLDDKDAVFKSLKVNKLGHVGVGYNRFNDSEKKILEKIHRDIEWKILRDNGNLTLYTKWEPCPSCYYVISQFSKLHPKVNIKVKYGEKYGEEVKS